MKTFFTLCSIVALSLAGTTSFAQINENFDNGFNALEANCWQFPSMQYASAPAGFVINGNGSPYSEPPVNSSSVRIMRTPYMYVSTTIEISFLYKLSENLNGQSTRYITLELINPSGATVQTLTNFNVPGTATTATLFNQTFAVNVPGPYRLSITMGGSNGLGNSRLSLDDLTVDSYFMGCDPYKVLPVHLMSFQGNMNKANKVTLNWTVADNETVNSFEVERSTNGKDFTTVAVVFASEKIGTESYTYFETVNYERVMYRLKMIDKQHDADYSKILVFSAKSINSTEIKILGNPVKDKLTLSFASNANQTVDIKVYDIAGKTLMSQKVSSAEGNNLVSLSLNATFKAGMYVVAVSNGTDVQTAKFVKQ